MIMLKIHPSHALVLSIFGVIMVVAIIAQLFMEKQDRETLKDYKNSERLKRTHEKRAEHIGTGDGSCGNSNATLDDQQGDDESHQNIGLS